MYIIIFVGTPDHGDRKRAAIDMPDRKRNNLNLEWKDKTEQEAHFSGVSMSKPEKVDSSSQEASTFESFNSGGQIMQL